MINFLKKTALKITLFDINSKIVNFSINQLKGVGKVFDLKIDFKQKTFKCNLKLNGEAEEISVSADGFSLLEKNGKYYINVRECYISREWMQTLVEQFICGKEIEISEMVYKSLTGLFER